MKVYRFLFQHKNYSLINFAFSRNYDVIIHYYDVIMTSHGLILMKMSGPLHLCGNMGRWQDLTYIFRGDYTHCLQVFFGDLYFQGRLHLLPSSLLRWFIFSGEITPIAFKSSSVIYTFRGDYTYCLQVFFGDCSRAQTRKRLERSRKCLPIQKR